MISPFASRSMPSWRCCSRSPRRRTRKDLYQDQPIVRRRLRSKRSGEAVAACARNGYLVSAVVVSVDGVRQAVLRGDGAPVHTLADSAFAKAYTAASLVPVRKEKSTKELFERVSKNPSTTTSLGNLPNITFTPGGITIFAGDEPIGGLGVGGAPGGNLDHDCADAALKKIADRMK